MFLVAFQEVRFGEAYRKRTSVWVSGTFLRELNKTCTGDHEHIQLSGWRNLKKVGSKNRPTKGTSKYPKQLCSEWANLVKKHLLKRK